MNTLDWEDANIGAVVRSEDINENSGDLFVPNFDLLSEEEQKRLASYKGDIEKVNVVSKFPLLPVKFSDEKVFGFQAQDYPGDQHIFRVLVPQGGVSVVDLYLK